MLKVIISSILVVAAVFIGFFPHSEQCHCHSLFKYYEFDIGWMWHGIIGSILYCLAVFISQHTFTYLPSDAINTIKDS
jgi:hypothetical protein